jgi:hypothetical protein
MPDSSHDLFIGDAEQTCRYCHAMARFIAHAREDVPWLCASLRETRKELAALLKLEALHRRVERERHEKLLARNTVLERVAEAALAAIATWEAGGMGNTSLQYSFGGMKFTDVCKIRAALAALEANTERRTECDSLNQ